MPRILALDVGNRRIGVAVSDGSKLIARPLCVIDRQREDALARLAVIASEQQADEVVIGFPYHADGKVSSQAELVRQFAQAVQVQLPVPITFVDERYTTQTARQLLAATKRRKAPQHDDAIAAAVILQRHLDAQRGDADDALFDETDET